MKKKRKKKSSEDKLHLLSDILGCPDCVSNGCGCLDLCASHEDRTSVLQKIKDKGTKKVISFYLPEYVILLINDLKKEMSVSNMELLSEALIDLAVRKGYHPVKKGGKVAVGNK